MSCEHDDCDIAIDGADPLEDLDPVELRHHHIEDDHMEGTLTYLVFDARRVTLCPNLEPVLFEEGLHVFENGLVVIDDQDVYVRYFNRHGVGFLRWGLPGGSAPWRKRPFCKKGENLKVGELRVALLPLSLRLVAVSAQYLATVTVSLD